MRLETVAKGASPLLTDCNAATPPQPHLWVVCGASRIWEGRVYIRLYMRGQRFNVRVSNKYFCKDFPAQDTLPPRRGEATKHNLVIRTCEPYG